LTEPENERKPSNSEKSDSRGEGRTGEVDDGNDVALVDDEETLLNVDGTSAMENLELSGDRGIGGGDPSKEEELRRRDGCLGLYGAEMDRGRLASISLADS
jgi:hypothetical protein